MGEDWGDKWAQAETAEAVRRITEARERLAVQATRPPEPGEREKAQAAMAEAVRSIGEAHAAMVATLARMVEGGASTADREAMEMRNLATDVERSVWSLDRSSRRWQDAVSRERTARAIAKAQGRDDG